MDKERQRIFYWADKLSGFDHFYMFSDSMDVWRKGSEKEKVLREEVEKANLSEDEKETILKVIGIRSDASYREAHIKYDCIAKANLWDEKDGPALKKACTSILYGTKSNPMAY